MNHLAERLVSKRDERPNQSSPSQSAPQQSDELFESLYVDIVDHLDTRAAADLDRNDMVSQIEALMERALSARGLTLPTRRQDALVQSIADEMIGLGPLEALLVDPDITDILVNGAERVYVEKHGVIERCGVRFRDDAHLLNTIRRIVARLGRRIDESSPMVDARLEDGSRVNAIIPPLAIDGPTLSIRRFRGGPVSFRDLYKKGSVSAAMSHYFKSAVRARVNILVCGGTGVGKTTMLNALSGYISRRERIITIEDSAELQLQQNHVVRLESRPMNMEGRGEISIRDLVRNALRMRPDRIIVGEVRADEVLDMIQAMNTGHDGSMTTVHANGVDDAFTRIAAMMSMAGSSLSEQLMMQMISRAVHVVVHLSRASAGQRCVATVSEVLGVKDGRIDTHTIFEKEVPALVDQGLGHAPLTWRHASHSTLLERFAAAGVPLDDRIFRGAHA